MFEASLKPRVFAVPPGADFPRSIADELKRAYAGEAPESLAKVQILVNAGRMKRRLLECFNDGTARLLPKIDLVSDLLPLVPEAEVMPTVSPLSRKLEMARLIAPLLESPVAPAPRASLYDLADSLIALLDEMHTEGVSPVDVLSLDVDAGPRHWAQSKEFLGIVDAYLRATSDRSMDPAEQQRVALDALVARWDQEPPETPVIVVGSTGSRGTTFELMRAVASLPQGAVVLPGFDFDMPESVWERLRTDTPASQDHAQYRYASFLNACAVSSTDVKRWPSFAPDPQRNALVSLALRPAPVTNQWRQEGAGHGDLRKTLQDVSLIIAPTGLSEASAIAVAIRHALEEQASIALITPDRTLSRRVTAALQRWGITPDDSAGVPLSLSPPGRLLRQVAHMMGQPVTPGPLIALLRHPLVRTGGDDRGDHSRRTNELELALRHSALPEVSPDYVTKQGESDPDRQAWAVWVAGLVNDLSTCVDGLLGDHARRHLEVAENASGGGLEGSGALWEKDAGAAAKSAMDRFLEDAVGETPVSLTDYRRLIDNALSGENVRTTEASRPDVLILGTLEARVNATDVVILGGLNDGIWPAAPSPDPWLSRGMREAAGLTSPDRQIGLSAHDFQQAIGSKHVILSRALRDDDAETVPSRWINRLVNLLDGLKDQNGPGALKQMRARGDRYLVSADALDAPQADMPPAPRPSPAPPSDVRPKKLSVTTVEKLIRDPYWIYARHILQLKPLGGLVPKPDAALKGQVFHKIMDVFISELRESKNDADPLRLLNIARNVMEESVPWVAVRRLWLGHIASIADAFAADERARQKLARNLATEVEGRTELLGTKFVITGEADRIDVSLNGHLIIYDYKSGAIPSLKQTRQFNPQILIEAVMAEAGGFSGIEPKSVAEGAYLSLGRNGGSTDIEMVENVITDLRRGETADFRTRTIEAELVTLLTAFLQEYQGYASRRAMEKMRFEGDYDHLARFGEWDETHTPKLIRLP